jgi:hypothetical protein
MDQTLPHYSSISPPVFALLDHKLHTPQHLHLAPAILSELQNQCYDLDISLTDLTRSLETSLVAYASCSDQVTGFIHGINAKLSDIRSCTGISDSSTDDGGGKRSEQILGEELPALAKEVARVEAVRIYAETALKLDTVVGDIEDAVSSTVNRNSRKSSQTSEDARLFAINSLKSAEDILTSVTKTRPQWARLVSAVDHRVDRALAVLRPQAIADHRSLLSSLGWPPPLSTDNNKSSQVSNPLFDMQGDLKQQYCENFLALCKLQELQRQRKSRQLEGYNREIAIYQPLWAIEELVNPLSIASQRHFSKWADKPELIFALVYKITRDYVDSMDELLQPLVDQAMLSGYSCREEWISSMVSSLSTYLAKEVFPVYLGQIDEEIISDTTKSPARSLFLNLVDLMISFDKRVHKLVSNSGIALEDGVLQKISSLSVFSDRPDWLDFWADIELNDTSDKLNVEMEDERSWSTLLLGEEHYKSPAISKAFLQLLSTLIDRCRALPSVPSRSRFVRVAAAPIVQKFLDCLFFRCQEAEGLTALTDNDALVKVTKSINAARYSEYVLKEWCEDIFFLEMGSNEESDTGILDLETEKMEEFRTEWVDKLSTVVLRGFDAQCRDYIKNKRQWQEKGEESWSVSKSFIGALDFLQGKMAVLEQHLNKIDFVWVWRNLAGGIDRLIFNGVFMSNAKFYDGGVEKIGNDLGVLFGVFGSWCLRPEGFFPKINEGLKLLKLGESLLEENGIRHLSAAEAERIAKYRVF